MEMLKGIFELERLECEYPRRTKEIVAKKQSFVSSSGNKIQWLEEALIGTLNKKYIASVERKQRIHSGGDSLTSF